LVHDTDSKAGYIATTRHDTDSKAIGPHSHTGFIIVATVDVGKVLHMTKMCDRSMTGKKLARRGYNSIVFNPGDGDEYIVYSNDRVISAKAYDDDDDSDDDDDVDIR